MTDINEQLIQAARDGNLDECKELLTKGADVNAKSVYGFTVLMLAASRGYTDIVKLLLEKGADVNAETNDGVTALGWAGFCNYPEIVELLEQATNRQIMGIEPSEDIKRQARMKLFIAVDKYSSKVRELLSKNLIYFAREGRLSECKELLEIGADIDAKNEYGNTALILAARFGHTEIVELLEQAGAK